MAMEARGYSGGEGRTRLHVLKIGLTDLAWLAGGLAAAIVLVMIGWQA